MTLKSLENATSVHYSQISRIERGGAASKSQNLQIICKYLKISANTNVRSPISEVSQRIELLTAAAPSLEPAVKCLLLAMEDLLAAANKT